MDFLYSLLAILNEMSPYVLLGFLIAGLLHVYVQPSLMSRHLSGNGLKPVLKAALFGIPLPLCSCGVLPTAVSLKRGGASNAASTSFLIATPQTGVDSIAATWSLLGPAMAVIRPVAALVCSVFGGVAVGRFAPDGPAEETVTEDGCGCGCGCGSHEHDEKAAHGFWHKIVEALRYGFVDMIGHVGKWLVIGLVIAALITVFVPDDFFVSLARYPLLAMLAMVVVAVPMYICATGSIPIALSLMIKGLTPGVAFVMLMAGPAANFASVMVLGKSIGKRATAIYVAAVVVTAIAFGLMIDLLLPVSWFIPAGCVGDVCHGGYMFGWFDTLCSAVLVLLLINAFYRSKSKPKHEMVVAHKLFTVNGMRCEHCRANVINGLQTLPGVSAVVVDLQNKSVEVTGEASPAQIISKIESLGFEAHLRH